MGRSQTEFVGRMKSIVLAVSATAVIALGIASVPTGSASAAAGGDCSDNSIVRCGVSSAHDMVAKARANQPDDLQAVYSKFGVTPDAYDAFASGAVAGTARQNGEIVANGQVVATNAYSLGRTKFSYSSAYPIGSKTYYKSQNTDVLKQDMPALLWFDAKGKLTAAILGACGNPMGGNTMTPGYACNQLEAQAIEGQANTYKYTVNAPASRGAVVSRVVYDFGDGQTVTKTNPREAVTHTYTQPGTHTAKATVYFRLPDGREVSASGSGCATQITIPAPKPSEWRCTALQATRKQGADEYTFSFQAHGTAQNARLIAADYDFGDGTVVNVPQSNSSSLTSMAEHRYAAPGTYTATATLRFAADENTDTRGKDAVVNCAATVTIAQPPAAPELPKTGPAAGVMGAGGLFAGTGALGAMGYHWRLRRKRSRIDSVVAALTRR